MKKATLALLAALVAGACAGGGSTPNLTATPAAGTPPPAASTAASPPASAATSTVPSAAATPGASPSAAATTPPAPTATASATPDGASGDLVALIPDEVSGITAGKTSYTGQEYVDLASGGSADAAALIEGQFTAMGASVDDVSVAGGDYYSDDDYVRISALRLAGADPATLLQKWVQNTIDSAPAFNPGMSASAQSSTVGGKPVQVVTTLLGSSVYQVQYIYGYGDTIFTVVGGSEDLIAEALSQLP
jgi:hypothetical protein